MPLHLTWQEVALRLFLSLIAGALIGINREEHGRPAGLRTTILVCLAASVAMIQTNLLLSIAGKTADSFVVMDLMRLPLGILSGMGFIGAGAIIRQGNNVHGVTTAATLWFVTVMGLCFGGGQIGLGIVTLLIGFGTLSGLKWLEKRLYQDRHASLTLVIDGSSTSYREINIQLTSQGFHISSCSIVTFPGEAKQKIQFDVHWRGRPHEPAIPTLYEVLAQRPGISKIEWHPTTSSP